MRCIKDIVQHCLQFQNKACFAWLCQVKCHCKTQLYCHSLGISLSETCTGECKVAFKLIYIFHHPILNKVHGYKTFFYPDTWTPNVESYFWKCVMQKALCPTFGIWYVTPLVTAESLSNCTERSPSTRLAHANHGWYFLLFFLKCFVDGLEDCLVGDGEGSTLTINLEKRSSNSLE